MAVGGARNRSYKTSFNRGIARESGFAEVTEIGREVVGTANEPCAAIAANDRTRDNGNGRLARLTSYRGSANAQRHLPDPLARCGNRDASAHALVRGAGSSFKKTRIIPISGTFAFLNRALKEACRCSQVAMSRRGRPLQALGFLKSFEKLARNSVVAIPLFIFQKRGAYPYMDTIPLSAPDCPHRSCACHSKKT